MVTVKCPHCNAALKLQQAPPSGKVKCPKCSNVVPVRSSAQAAAARTAPARTAPAAQSGRMLDPDDEGFDFGRINYPTASPVTAVSHFPTAGQRHVVYQGPIPGDPLEALAQEDAAEHEQPEVAAAPAKKVSPMLVVGALGGVGVLVIGAIIGAVMLGGSGGGSSGPSEDVLAALKATAPSGYQAVGYQGCAILMPKGREPDGVEKLSTSMERTGVISAATGSFFFFGVMPGSNQELTERQLQKNAERQLRGGTLGISPTTRNGYKGAKTKLDQSLFVPDMQIEIFCVDGRYVILGCALGSQGASTDVQMSADRGLEQAEQTIFFDSFKIGPKPSGLFW